MKQVFATLFFVTTMIFSASGQAATATPVAEAETATPAAASADAIKPAGSLAEIVRQNTDQFQDVQAAKDAGYALFPGCVSDPGGGAMGIHYANGDLVGDGKIDAQHPEAMIYEQSYGQLHLVGVEYIVLAKDWDANNKMPPVLMGQLLNYVSAPNRYGMPDFYELHVWAWKNNPSGMFADWNPNVSCEEYTGDTTMAGTGQ